MNTHTPTTPLPDAEAQEIASAIESQITNERMCIKGRWWVPVDSYEQANPVKPDAEALVNKIETLKEGVYYVDGQPNVSVSTQYVNETVREAVDIIRKHYE